MLSKNISRHQENLKNKNSIANANLDKLIKELQNNSNDFQIKNRERLVASIKHLRDNVIGMSTVKNEVADLTKLLITNPKTKVMIHSVIYGPPGVGKTSVAKVIANVVSSIGFLGEKDSDDDGSKGGYSKLKTETGLDSKMNLILIMILILTLGLPLLDAFLKGSLIIKVVIIIVICAVVSYFLYLRYQSRNRKSFSASQMQNSPMMTFADEDNLRVVGKEDLVAGFVGQSALKTKKILEECNGKVLFIDEAYSLITGGGANADSFGVESLNVICQYMTEFPRRTMIIFGGYRHLLMRLFEVQPGFKRRVVWQFDCPKYEADELFAIFNLQIEKNNWMIRDKEKIKQFFKENGDKFPENGGSTENLALFSEIAHSKNYFYNRLTSKQNVIDIDDVKEGMKKLIENNIEKDSIKPNNDQMNENFERSLATQLEKMLKRKSAEDVIEKKKVSSESETKAGSKKTIEEPKVKYAFEEETVAQ